MQEVEGPRKIERTWKIYDFGEAGSVWNLKAKMSQQVFAPNFRQRAVNKPGVRPMWGVGFRCCGSISSLCEGRHNFLVCNASHIL